MNRHGLALSILAMTGVSCRDAQRPPSLYGVGRPATAEEIQSRAISIARDGTGLPAGHGTAEEGRTIYTANCASCHGDRGQGAGDYPQLVGGVGSLKSNQPILTVGSYWPYATTIWDYTRRAMPYQRPGTLTPNETYALTAYVLHLNGIVDEKTELNETTLPSVKMPNRDGFALEPQPSVPPIAAKYDVIR
jgi:hypothetical protein